MDDKKKLHLIPIMIIIISLFFMIIAITEILIFENKTNDYDKIHHDHEEIIKRNMDAMDSLMNEIKELKKNQIIILYDLYYKEDSVLNNENNKIEND